MSSAAIEKSKIKLLNSIIRLGPSGAGWSKRNSEVILGGQQGKIVFKASIVDLAKSDGLITVDEKTMAITSAGKSKVRRHLCDHQDGLRQLPVRRLFQSSAPYRHQRILQRLRRPLLPIPGYLRH